MLFASGAVAQEEWRQAQADDYTRYEIQAPESRSFRIIYDTTAVSPGAKLFFNPIRRGSTPTVHGVTDLATGKPLEWKLVTGAQAKADGWMQAAEDMNYIRVELAKPVPALEVPDTSISPAAGEARLRIDKTYRDPESVKTEGDLLVFERTLGIPRNAVVFPAGYELVSANVPVQVQLESDGRIRASFLRRGGTSTPLRVAARRLPAGKFLLSQEEGGALVVPPPGQRVSRSGARLDFAPTERSFQDREIVYELRDPASHSFRLFHDYTEIRPGRDRYLNVDRAGSKASDREAWDLDSGKKLKVETLRGPEITARSIDVGSQVESDTEVVLISYEPVAEGGSRRLRIEETYTDASRYGLHRGELLWDRSFGRPRNAIVLPAGWALVETAEPARVRQLPDGRIRLDFDNDRPGVVEVFVRARLR